MRVVLPTTIRRLHHPRLFQPSLHGRVSPTDPPAQRSSLEHMEAQAALAALIAALPAGSVAAFTDPALSAGEIIDNGPAEPVPVYSVTKMFVAAGVLRALDAQLLSLEEPLASRLPGAPAGCSIGEALHHTAGLGDYTASVEYLHAVQHEPASPWELEQIVAASTDGTPGSFEYSNTGYWYLGALLEKLSGMKLSQYLHRKVFAPADMRETRYPDIESSLIHTGYSTLWAGPAGAAYSTPADLLRFMQFMIGNQGVWIPPLSECATKEFFATVPANAPAPWVSPAYGTGVMVDRDLGVWGHGGSGPLYRSAVFSDFDSGLTAAAICPGHGPYSPEERLLGWFTSYKQSLKKA